MSEGTNLRGGRANGAKFLRNFLLPFARRRALGQNASRSVLSLSSKAKVKCGFAAFARARPRPRKPIPNLSPENPPFLTL